MCVFVCVHMSDSLSAQGIQEVSLNDAGLDLLTPTVDSHLVTEFPLKSLFADQDFVISMC